MRRLTTVLEDSTYKKLRVEAAEQEQSMSGLVKEIIEDYLEEDEPETQPKTQAKPKAQAKPKTQQQSKPKEKPKTKRPTSVDVDDEFHYESGIKVFTCQETNQEYRRSGPKRYWREGRSWIANDGEKM